MINRLKKILYYYIMFNTIDYNLYIRIADLENLINNDIATLQNRIKYLKLTNKKEKKVSYNKQYYNKVKDNEEMKIKYNTNATSYYHKIKGDAVKYSEYLNKKRLYRQSLKNKCL